MQWHSVPALITTTVTRSKLPLVTAIRTLSFTRESFNGLSVDLAVRTHRKVPTLYGRCGDKYDHVASYVRSYRVLNHYQRKIQ